MGVGLPAFKFVLVFMSNLLSFKLFSVRVLPNRLN
jgi:hypothetical protein